MTDGRARRAMELLALAEVAGVVFNHERERAVLAARAVLCDEFWDVSLYWIGVRGSELPTTDEPWQLCARADGEICRWQDVRPELFP